MLMTHGFADAENKLTGRLDPLHPAFSGRFAAYSWILRRSRVEDRVARQDRPIRWLEVLPRRQFDPRSCLTKEQRVTHGRRHIACRQTRDFWGLLVSAYDHD